MHRPFRRLAVTASLAVAACATPPEMIIEHGPAPVLDAHEWRLHTAMDSRNRPIEALASHEARELVFRFSGERLDIQGACNVRGGRFQITREGLVLARGMPTTMMACEPALMQADAVLSQLLATPSQIDVANGANPQLRLISASRDTLVFHGRLTHEARYGPPTTIFLEVSAQRVPCHGPKSVGARCLKVRERHYDRQGLPAGAPGAWRTLVEDIEGFTPVEGERNVLRVKRFTRAPGASGATANVYVLDAKIESEVVGR